jgi:predicted peroxiredoxin
MNRNHLLAPALAVILLVAVATIPSLMQTADAASEKMKKHGSGHTEKHNTILIHIKSGDPSDEFQLHSAQMGVEHAKAFLDAKKKVVVFLDVNGVRLIDQSHPEELSYLYDTLEAFVSGGGRIIACEHCLMMNEIDSPMKGVELDSHPKMSKLVKVLDSSRIVLDY